MPNTFSEGKTAIDGLRLLFNNAVGDGRGVFADLAEEDNPIFGTAMRHIHTSIAAHKGVARGCHYHNIQTETFYALSGTGLCVFHDFRADSETRGATYAIILGHERPGTETTLPVHTIDQGTLAQIIVPPGVYHGFWPMSDERLVLVATSTHRYDPTDYVRPSLDEIPDLARILRQHNLAS